MIAAIMGADPPPVATLQSAPLLDHLLERCLEKDRERRWQSMADVTSELRWIASQPLTVPASAPPRKRLGVWQWLAAALIAFLVLFVIAPLALVAGLQLLETDEPASLELTALQLEVTTPPTDDPSTALSPDGTQLAFIANQNRVPMLWVRSLDAPEMRALPATEGASYPFWAPDGRSLGFFAGDTLKRIEVAGGMPIVVADAPTGRGGTWNSDGVMLFVSDVTAPIMRVPVRGGPAERVTQVNAGSGPAHRLPQFLPDGKRFLFTSTLGTAETNGVYLGSLDKTPPVRLLAGDTGGRFAAPGALLAVRQGALQAYRFNPASATVQGDPVTIAQGFSTSAAAAVFGVSGTGVLAYRTGAAQRRQLVWVNRQGATLRAIGEAATDFVASPELSPDEQSVVVFRQRSGGNDIWVIELARGLERRVTDGQTAHAHPLWDPGGQHVVFTSSRFGRTGPGRQAVNGGKAEPMLASDESGQALSWTRDRQHMLMLRTSEKGGSDLVAVSASGEPGEVVVAQSQYNETEGQFSPDGRWVAFVSTESGRPEVFVQSFPEGRSRTQVSTAGGTQVRWSGDGKEIFYVAPDGKMMAVSVAVAGASFEVKAPAPLFQTFLATGINVIGNKPQYAVSRDGRFLLNTAIESASAPIVVSVNWQEELKRLVPTR